MWGNRGFNLMEMMVVVAIISILALMALPSYLDRIVRQQIEAALPLADVAKGPISAWWLATQTFPPDNATLALPVPEKIVSNFIEKLIVRDGAIQLDFGNRANGAIRGKSLSLRPAVMPDAPVVPIAWVCGYAEAPAGMTIQGQNQTNIPEVLLPMDCRALKR